MSPSLRFLLIPVCLIFCIQGLSAQTDKEQIVALRSASNAALKAYDHDKVLSFLSDEALTTTGNGTLLCGKEKLAQYIESAGASKMYWIRDSQEIVVNTSRGLAWETGVWNGYDPDRGKEPVIHGNYSAMWTRASGTWKIKSQLFVTLGE